MAELRNLSLHDKHDWIVYEPQIVAVVEMEPQIGQIEIAPEVWANVLVTAEEGSLDDIVVACFLADTNADVSYQVWKTWAGPVTEEVYNDDILPFASGLLDVIEVKIEEGIVDPKELAELLAADFELDIVEM